MRSPSCFLSGPLLITLRSPLTTANPQRDAELRRPSPSLPARLFTVRAYMQYGLPGPDLMGLPMIARGGNFYLDSSNSTSASNAPVMSVDATGRAFLVSLSTLPSLPESAGRLYIVAEHFFSTHRNQCQVQYTEARGARQAFIDTADGRFGYSGGDGGQMPAGAMVVNFVHEGAGTAFFTPYNGYPASPPAVLQWIGAPNNPSWYACPEDGKQDYQLFKEPTFQPLGFRNNICFPILLAALDYSGPGVSG